MEEKRLSSFPDENSEKIINNIIRREGFIDHRITIEPGSSKGDNYLGIIHRIIAESTKDEEPKRLNLILKSAPKYAREKVNIDIFFKRELYTYKTVLPMFCELQNVLDPMDRLQYAKFYDGDDTMLQEMLVLEDMKAAGFVMSSRQKSLDFQQMQLLMKCLATLHSLSFALKEQNKSKFDELTQNIYEGIEFDNTMFRPVLKMLVDKAIDAMDDDICISKLKSLEEDIMEKFIEYRSADIAAPYTVLCHGDCWTNNILFKYQDGNPVELILLDWQMIKHASPIVDLSYLIFSSTDQNLREKHYFEFLDIYYNSLEKNLMKLKCDINVCYPKQIFEKQIKTIMPFGLIMAFLTAPMFMSEDEDIIDMDEVMKKETIDEQDIQLKNEKSKERYEERIRGVVKDFVKLDLI